MRILHPHIQKRGGPLIHIELHERRRGGQDLQGGPSLSKVVRHQAHLLERHTVPHGRRLLSSETLASRLGQRQGVSLQDQHPANGVEQERGVLDGARS